MPQFADSLITAIKLKKSACVVGLDPDIALMPHCFTTRFSGEHASLIFEYNKMVIDAVHDIVPIVKPQSAYYELYGHKGILALEKTIKYAKSRGLLVLLDAKRGDIGSTSVAYARAYLDGQHSDLRADAITLNPYLGPDSISPFVEYAVREGAGIFVCAMTSNPGASYLQHLVADGKPIYLHVANMVAGLNKQIGCRSGYCPIGVVAGATYPQEASELRKTLPTSFFLVPGMGAQGGDENTLKNFFDAQGLGAIVSSSRAVMYPSPDAVDLSVLHQDIRSAAVRLNEAVNRARHLG